LSKRRRKEGESTRQQERKRKGMSEKKQIESNPTSIKGKTILKENDAQREEDSSQRFFGGEFSPNGDLFIY
jgi:hypothetical protein